MCAASSIPTLSEIGAWDTEHLGQAATHWSTTADTWEDAFDHVAQEMPSPGGTPWQGDAAEAAQARATADRVKVRGIADDLRVASTLARSASKEIAFAKMQALHAVGEAHAQGFVVGEDLGVTDRYPSATSAERAVRQAQAQALALDIRTKAVALAAVDEQFASQIASATAGLGSVSFEESPSENGSAIQAVDFITGPLPEEPSFSSPEPPPGGWSDDPITRAAQKIAYGHASTKHLSEFPSGMTREQLAAEVERIMRAGTNPNGGMIVGRTRDGVPAIYDPKTNTLVIRNPGAADAGTVYRPERGESYVLNNKAPIRVPSIPASELGDAPLRPPVEPPAPRVVPRGGLPPMVGLPPIIDLPRPGTGEIPVLDADGIPNAGEPQP